MVGRTEEFDTGSKRVEYQGPSPLDYRESTSLHPHRVALVDPSAGEHPSGDFGFAERKSLTYTNPATGRSLKKPRQKIEPGAAPGVVAFVDYSHPKGSDVLHINYMKTRSDQRGQGHASQVLEHIISRHSGSIVDFGKMQNETAHRLKDRMAERFPDKTFYGKRNY